nr:hypothetical protein [Tanacetum cinerariifolium]
FVVGLGGGGSGVWESGGDGLKSGRRGGVLVGGKRGYWGEQYPF